MEDGFAGNLHGPVREAVLVRQAQQAVPEEMVDMHDAASPAPGQFVAGQKGLVMREQGVENLLEGVQALRGDLAGSEGVAALLQAEDGLGQDARESAADAGLAKIENPLQFAADDPLRQMAVVCSGEPNGRRPGPAWGFAG